MKMTVKMEIFYSLDHVKILFHEITPRCHFHIVSIYLYLLKKNIYKLQCLWPQKGKRTVEHVCRVSGTK